MAETAVGLFENATVADQVVTALRSSGIPESGIRVVSGAKGLAVDSATSTPELDAEAALGRDLRSLGASDRESEIYVKGVARGNVIVFATGTSQQASTATDLMNDHFALDVEEFSGSVPELTPVGVGVEGSVGGPNVTEKIEHHRNRTEGAKVFSW